MSVRIDSTLQTYLAAVTIPGDFSGLPDGDFEVALGSYTTPGAFQAPDAVSINSTVSVTLTGRLGAGKSFDPVANTYYLWGRATKAPDETLTRGSTRITVVTDGGTPVGAAVRYVPQQATAPDHTVYEGWLDSSTSPPTLKGWDGSAWVAIGGGGSGGVTTFNTRAGAVTLSKADVTGTGLAAADVGADASGAASTAQAAAIAAATTDATTKVAAEATARTSAIATQHTADLAAFDAAGAAATAQAAAIAASQPVDADLTAIAALATTTFGRSVLTQADAAALRSLAGLGTAATQASTAFDTAGAAAAAQAASQPLDSDLTAIAALTTTAFGRSFLALADAAAGRTLLGLGTLATQSGTFSGTSSGTNTGDQDLSGLVTKALLTTKGDVIAASAASTPARVGAGSDGQVLTADAASTAGVKWAAAAGGSLTRQLKSANFTATVGHEYALDTSSGTFTATIDLASNGLGQTVVKWVAGTVPPTIAASGSDHFDITTGSTGGAFVLLNQTGTYDSDGTSIWTVRNSFALSTLDTRFGLAGLRRSGGYYAVMPTSGNNGTTTLNQLYAMPLLISNSCTVDRMAAWCTTVGTAGAVARLGIYRDNGSGLPGTLLLDAGTVACDVGTGAKEITVSQALTPGLYWAAVVSQTAIAAFSLNGGASGFAPYIPLGWSTSIATNGQTPSSYQMTGVTGALGTFTLANVLGSTAGPNIWVRFA